MGLVTRAVDGGSNCDKGTARHKPNGLRTVRAHATIQSLATSHQEQLDWYLLFPNTTPFCLSHVPWPPSNIYACTRWCHKNFPFNVLMLSTARQCMYYLFLIFIYFFPYYAFRMIEYLGFCCDTNLHCTLPIPNNPRANLPTITSLIVRQPTLPPSNVDPVSP
jgi:hypothetical protein